MAKQRRIGKSKRARTLSAKSPTNTLDIQWVEIGKVRPYHKNPRKKYAASIPKVAKSIETFGWRQPIVVDTKMVIIAGHGRHAAALELGLEKIPIHVATDLSETQARAYRIADNRTAEESSWDEPNLIEELLALRAAEIDDLAITGFDVDQVVRLTADEDSEPDAGRSRLGAELQYRVLVECDGEEGQRAMLERFEREGLKCRALIS